MWIWATTARHRMAARLRPWSTAARVISRSQCASGFCAQGVCCQAACGGVCQSCNLPGQAGQCLPVPAGEDPGEQCPADAAVVVRLRWHLRRRWAPVAATRRGPSAPRGPAAGRPSTRPAPATAAAPVWPGMMRACASGTCMGGTCAAPCALSTECQSGFFCDAGRCALKRAPWPLRAAWPSNVPPGYCVDGVCCMSECGEHCFACNVAGLRRQSASRCPLARIRAISARPRPAGTLWPRWDVQRRGRLPLAPGRHGLRQPRPAAGAPRPRRAAVMAWGFVARPPRRATVPPMPAAPRRARSAAWIRPAARRDSAARPTSVRGCPGLALFWRFEEPSGITAFDSSGNGRDGLVRRRFWRARARRPTFRP